MSSRETLRRIYAAGVASRGSVMAHPAGITIGQWFHAPRRPSFPRLYQQLQHHAVHKGHVHLGVVGNHPLHRQEAKIVRRNPLARGRTSTPTPIITTRLEHISPSARMHPARPIQHLGQITARPIIGALHRLRFRDRQGRVQVIGGNTMTNGNEEARTRIGVSEGADNTARKQAEEALLKAGALQSAIFNSANFSSIATDAKGVIQIFNVGAERMLGYTAAEVMNKITPADISDPQELIARAKALSVELGTPITPGFEALVFKASRGIEDIYELTYIRKDGSRFAAVVSVTALRDAQDAIIGYLLIGTDNTARQQAEEALLKAGALQSAIFNSANFSSIATDAKGVIQIFNVGAERMLGYTAAEVMNKITPADISDPQELIARAKALSVELGTPITPGFEALVFKASRGIEDIYELTYIRKDGSRFPAVVSVTALRDAQDVIIGYLLIGTETRSRRGPCRARSSTAPTSRASPPTRRASFRSSTSAPSECLATRPPK